MTETEPETETTETEPYDPLAAMTLNELSVGARALKASLVVSITGRTVDYEQALGVLLWLHRRRADPHAQWADVRLLSFDAVTDELHALGADESRPTTPGP